MKLSEIFAVTSQPSVFTEASIRQWKRHGKQLIAKYRCLSGSKVGKLVKHPGDCAVRKDPKKVRHGRRVMRAKKGAINRKALITKKTSFSKMLSRLNMRLSGNL